MPTSARKLIVPDGADCVVHVISRCVRRAWLCGQDPLSGKDFEHRREWVRDRVKLLVEVFAIEVCAYAIMSNHSHFVLWCRPSVVENWSAEDVARRWLRVFGGYVTIPPEEDVQRLAENDEKIAVLRDRLGSVSWFMRCLNEYIARKANFEDECSGRFWEGRFKCQLLEDDGAVMACMAYVDLNPVRAKMAESLETSAFTSIHDRICGRRARAEVKAAEEAGILMETKADAATDVAVAGKAATPEQAAMLAKAGEESKVDAWLCPFGQAKGHTVLDLQEESYLTLLDWTGRNIAEGKEGVIPKELRPLLENLDLEVEQWLTSVQRYGGIFHRVAGRVETLRRKATEIGQQWLAGVKGSSMVFRNAESAAG